MSCTRKKTLLRPYRTPTVFATFSCREERCPHGDDRDPLIEKIAASDGVVFATPNYSFQVSGIMKVFLDRLGFLFHRPRFFGKAFTSIVAQGIYGAGKIVDYLDFVGGGLGFNTVKGCCVKTMDPMTERARAKADGSLAGLSRRFHQRLERSAYPRPTLFRLMLFRMSRTSIRLMPDASSRDWSYYSEEGWLESDCYYPTRPGPVATAAGNLFGFVAARTAKPEEAAVS